MENTARWEAIAAAVPGRGPQECLDQCRVLAAAVKGASSADEAKARFKLASAQQFIFSCCEVCSCQSEHADEECDYSDADD